MNVSRWTCRLVVTWYFLLASYECARGFQDCPRNSMAQYKIDLRGTWTTSNFNLQQQGFPDQWRWSTGIGVSLDARTDPKYNETIRMKIYNFVTKGGLSHTVSQLSKPGSGVLDSFLIPSTDSGAGEASAMFFIDSNHSRVSFMSRMNKKPYWILSVESVNLCHNGQFRDTFELDLFPFESKPRPSQTHGQTMRSNSGGSTARPVNGQYSIVLPSQTKAQLHRNRISLKFFPGQTLVAPLPYLVQRETQHSAAAAVNVEQQMVVAPSRLEIQTWKHLPEPDSSLSLYNQTRLEQRNILLAGIGNAGTFTEPLTAKSKPATSDLPWHRSDPYTKLDDPRSSPNLTVTSPVHRQTTDKPTKAPHILYPALGSPKLSRRRLPPDSENEVPLVRRAIRSAVRPYGVRLTGQPRTARNSSGNLHYAVKPTLYLREQARPAQRSRHEIQSPHRNINLIPTSSPPVFGPQQRKSPQQEALPRLATAKFTKIASYRLSHLLALAKRRLRNGEAPLPITIDKSMINSVYRSHQPRAQRNRNPSRVSGPATYDGMWPSSSVTAVEQQPTTRQKRRRGRPHKKTYNPPPVVADIQNY